MLWTQLKIRKNMTLKLWMIYWKQTCLYNCNTHVLKLSLKIYLKSLNNIGIVESLLMFDSQNAQGTLMKGDLQRTVLCFHRREGSRRKRDNQRKNKTEPVNFYK